MKMDKWKPLVLLILMLLASIATAQVNPPIVNCNSLSYSYPNFMQKPLADPLQIVATHEAGPESRHVKGAGWTATYFVEGTNTRQIRSRMGEERTTPGACEARLYFVEAAPYSEWTVLSVGASIPFGEIFSIGTELWSWTIRFGGEQQTLFNVARRDCTMWVGRYWLQEKRGELEFNGVYSYLKLSSSGDVLESVDILTESDLSEWEHHDFKTVPAVSKRCR